MCSLCGVLGGSGDWTEAAARPGVYTPNTDALARRRERMRRVAVANTVLRHFRMSLSDWQGASYLLSTATGKTEIVDNLTHLWLGAEKLACLVCDPLDPALIDHMEASHG